MSLTGFEPCSERRTSTVAVVEHTITVDVLEYPPTGGVIVYRLYYDNVEFSHVYSTHGFFFDSALSEAGLDNIVFG